jgi:hypothetical protein
MTTTITRTVDFKHVATMHHLVRKHNGRYVVNPYETHSGLRVSIAFEEPGDCNAYEREFRDRTKRIVEAETIKPALEKKWLSIKRKVMGRFKAMLA